MLLKTSSTVLPDSTFLTLLLGATYCLLRLLRSRTIGSSALTGVLYGLTVLASAESVLCIVSSLVVAGFGVRQPWRSVARCFAVVLLTAVAVCAPYVASALQAGVLPFETALVTALKNLAEVPPGLTSMSLVALPVLITLGAIGLWSSGGGVVPQSVLAAVLIGGAMGASSLPTIGLLPVLFIWASSGLSPLSKWLCERVGAGQSQLAWVRVVVALVVLSMVGVPAYLHVAEGRRASWMVWNAGWWLGEVPPDRKRVMDASATIAFHASAAHVPFPEGDSTRALDLIEGAKIDFIVVRSGHVPGAPYIEEWLHGGLPDPRARLVYARRDGDAQITLYKWVRDQNDLIPALFDRDSRGQRDPDDPSHAPVMAATQGPLRRNPVNPRYFTDDTRRAIYLTGAHTWANLQDGSRLEPLGRFDYERYLGFLESHGLNLIRLWAWEQADWVPSRPYHFRFAPVLYARTGPALALDHGPQFDVTQFDEEYFRRLRTRVASAGARNIYVIVMLFQGWSVETKSRSWEDPWRGHPYHRENNVNGIDGDPGRVGDGRFVHTLGDTRIVRLQEQYVEKVVDTLNDLNNVLFEICNECDGSSLEWQSHMVRLIHRLESDEPKQHPVGMTALWPGGRNVDLFRSPADWVSPGIEDGYDGDPPAADGSKVVITDTDHIFGIGGDRGWVWKSFLRGLNPIFMDPYDHSWPVGPGTFLPGEVANARWEEVRRSMGHTAEFASRIDLVSMRPRGDLCSSAFCLARPDGLRPEYLIYNPIGGRVTIDLRGTPGEMDVEWFDPKTGERKSGDRVTGGAVITFAPPFAGDVVLHLSSMK